MAAQASLGEHQCKSLGLKRDRFIYTGLAP